MPLEEIYKLFLSCTPGFSTDTRKDVAGTFFIALKGESFDGNKYASDALSKGAAFAVVDDPSLREQDSRMILVPNTNEFLAKLAKYHREKLAIPIICIGGSNGKTTTREMAVTLLREKYNVSTNFENENNIFGISYTILRTKPEHELLVLEIGSNHLGEHAQLLPVSSPDYLLLTNMGRDHLGEYGGIENAEKENFELYDYAKKHNKKVFVPAFEKDLARKAESLGVKPIVFDSFEPLPGLNISFEYEEETIRLPIFGEYMIKNVSAATAIAGELGLGAEDIKNGLKKIRPVKLRGEILAQEDNTLVLDCYNSNPSSLSAALESFSKNSKAPNAVILGDMRELGEFAEIEHRAIVEGLPKYGFDLVILVGENFLKLEDEHNYKVFPAYPQAKEFIENLHLKNYQILVKGSRGERLEKIFLS